VDFTKEGDRRGKKFTPSSWRLLVGPVFYSALFSKRIEPSLILLLTKGTHFRSTLAYIFAIKHPLQLPQKCSDNNSKRG